MERKRKIQRTEDEQVVGDDGLYPEVVTTLLALTHRSLYQKAERNFEEHPTRNITFATVALIGLGTAARGVVAHHRHHQMRTRYS